jgi:uncharacterized protein YhbP (UPF0306 family)
MDVEKIVREYLTKTVHMSLATVKENKPWVCEVHFAYDDELNLYWRSSPDRRHSKELENNPNVAGNIVATFDLETGCGGAIYFEGTARRLESEDEIRATFPAFQKHLGKEEDIIDDALSGKGNSFYKVTVKNWAAFGDFGNGKLQKYELAWHN